MNVLLEEMPEQVALDNCFTLRRKHINLLHKYYHDALLGGAVLWPQLPFSVSENKHKSCQH